MAEDAKWMTTDALRAELATLGAEWDKSRDDDEGHGGSPGEWVYERMNEIETELKKRKRRT